MKRTEDPEPQFYLYLAVVFLSGLALGVILMTTPLYLIDQKISGVEYGLLIGIASIGSIFVKFPIGLLSDKVSKKTLLYIGSILLAITTVLIPMERSLLFPLRIIQGFSMGITYIPLATLFVEMFRASRYGWYNSVVSLGISAIGPVLGGFLPGIIGFNYTFAFSGILLLTSSIILVNVKEPTTVIKKEKEDKNKDLRSLTNSILFGMSNSAVVVIFMSFMPVFLVKILNDGSMAGVVAFIYGVTFSIFAIQIGKVSRTKRIYILFFGSLSTLVVFVFLYLTVNLLQLIIVSILVGISAATVRTISFAMAAESLSEKGKAIGLYQTGNDMGGFIGPSFAGLLSAEFGIRYAFLSIIPIIILCWIIFFILKRKEKK